MVSNNNREKYWNEEYYMYWKSRVEEANKLIKGKSKIVNHDSITISDLVYKDLLNQISPTKGTLLDVGCGWGRHFPLYAKYNMKIYGVDISSKMIEEAKSNFGHVVAEIKKSTAENIDYSNNSFDYVCCFGVFDATDQNKSLSDMIRVAKLNGKIIITGKNDNYHDDDNAALAAEIGARKKGEPNFFTNTKNMINQLENNDHKLIITNFYLRRGDFAKNQYEEKIPEKFYEYLLVFEKDSEKRDFSEFSSEYSIVNKTL